MATLNAMLRRHTGYVVLAKQVSQDNAGKISTDTFPGITLVGDSKRIVPNGNLASPVIGFTNGSGVGAAGIEYGDNQKLAGTSGKLTLLESPSGVALPQSPVTDRVASTAGKGLELTLDSQLQYESEQALAGAIETSQALSGTAIVEDVKTGQILSMASLVSTHPNAAVSATAPAVQSTGGVIPIGPADPVNEAPSNLAVSQVFEPGSVFKLVTFSAALADGLINPNTVFSVPDQIKLDGSTFHDAESHPTEALTATQILAQSSNIGTGEIAQSVGEQRLLDQVRNLGFGQYTGLGFPGESPGLLATAAQWEPTDYVSLPIGQVDAVNALQMLDAYNAVANGGVYVQPKLVEANVSASGTRDQDAPFPDPSGLLSLGRLRADLHAGAGRGHRDRDRCLGPGLYGGGQDRYGADPDTGEGLLRHRRLHGVLRGLCPGGEPDAVHHRGPRPPDPHLRGHRGRSGLFPDHELRPASLRHPDNPRCDDDAPLSDGIGLQPGPGHHITVTRYHQRADGLWFGLSEPMSPSQRRCEPCR